MRRLGAAAEARLAGDRTLTGSSTPTYQIISLCISRSFTQRCYHQKGVLKYARLAAVGGKSDSIVRGGYHMALDRPSCSFVPESTLQNPKCRQVSNTCSSRPSSPPSRQPFSKEITINNRSALHCARLGESTCLLCHSRPDPARR